jgi:hypothetical protein
MNFKDTFSSSGFDFKQFDKENEQKEEKKPTIRIKFDIDEEHLEKNIFSFRNLYRKQESKREKKKHKHNNDSMNYLDRIEQNILANSKKGDFYDIYDPFIDDSEFFDLDDSMTNNINETTTNGFFVWKGEFDPLDKILEDIPKISLDDTTDETGTTDDEEEEEEEEEEQDDYDDDDDEEQEEGKNKKKKDKSKDGKIKLKSSNDSNKKNKHSTEDEEKKKQKKKEKDKDKDKIKEKEKEKEKEKMKEQDNDKDGKKKDKKDDKKKEKDHKKIHKEEKKDKTEKDNKEMIKKNGIKKEIKKESNKKDNTSSSTKNETNEPQNNNKKSSSSKDEISSKENNDNNNEKEKIEDKETENSKKRKNKVSISETENKIVKKIKRENSIIKNDGSGKSSNNNDSNQKNNSNNNNNNNNNNNSKKEKELVPIPFTDPFEKERGKKFTAVLYPLPQSLTELIDNYRKTALTLSWDQKRTFPTVMKNLLGNIVKLAIDLELCNDNFRNHIQSCIPYNAKTIKNLINRRLNEYLPSLMEDVEATRKKNFQLFKRRVSIATKQLTNGSEDQGFLIIIK